MSVQTPSNNEAIAAAEIVEVETTRVKCDGGGPLGHPLVYLEMGDEDFFKGLRYYLTKHAYQPVDTNDFLRSMQEVSAPHDVI